MASPSGDSLLRSEAPLRPPSDQMIVIFTNHVRSRMSQRDVTEGDVRNALRNVHTRYQTPTPSWCLEGPGLNDKTLRIWCPPGKAGPDRYIVKSTAWKE